MAYTDIPETMRGIYRGPVMQARETFTIGFAKYEKGQPVAAGHPAVRRHPERFRELDAALVVRAREWFALAGGRMIVSAGDLFLVDDPLVLAHPQLFAPLVEPEPEARPAEAVAEVDEAEPETRRRSFLERLFAA